MWVPNWSQTPDVVTGQLIKGAEGVGNTGSQNHTALLTQPRCLPLLINDSLVATTILTLCLIQFFFISHIFMFSTPAPASGSRNVAASALRKAGLIDKDTQMRDGDKNSQGGKKVTPKSRRRVRGAETAKVQTLGSSQRSVIITTHSSLSDRKATEDLGC